MKGIPANLGGLLAKSFRSVIITFILNMIMLTLLVSPYKAFAADDVAEMRKQLADQRALIQAQQRQLDQQAQQLERMNQRLDAMTAGKAGEAPAVAVAQQAVAADAKQGSASPGESDIRDIVGDLNAAAVRAGDFSGAFRIPGPKNISLAIGGFVKAVAIADTKAETTGSNFLPAYLGTRRSDTDGAFGIDASLTKMFLDARAPAGNSQLRGYIEADLNNSNDGTLSVRWRHAYGSWTNSYGTLVGGHTWSTLMDLKILPESLTEPTVSGAVFMRQPQIRWSQPFGSSFTLHAAIEDPSSNDVFDSGNSPELGNTRYPDGILGLEYDRKGVGHLRLNGIVRDIRVSLPTGRHDNELAWGLALSGHLEFLKRDRWVFGGIYGEGLGRYLLGIQSTAGSIIDPVRNKLRLRDNWGVLTAYQHHWTETLRSYAMIGYAKAKPYRWQQGSTFESSTYGAVNLMWQILPYLTGGIEYAYGKRENKDGPKLDNHRVSVGFQFY